MSRVRVTRVRGVSSRQVYVRPRDAQARCPGHVWQPAQFDQHFEQCPICGALRKREVAR